jgi:hypothetical protein
MPFCTHFKEIQESSPYIYASDKCNNFVCVNIYYVMHMTGGSQRLKFRETYAKSAKTGQSNLETGSSDFISKTTKTGTSPPQLRVSLTRCVRIKGAPTRCISSVPAPLVCLW